MIDPSAASLVSKLIYKPVADLYDLARVKFGEGWRDYVNHLSAKELRKKLNTVQKVKTIWQPEREVNLKSFYYPTKLLLNGGCVTINRIDQLPLETNIVVQGTVGQGKSIFMRYLSYREILIEGRIPVFVELRKVSSSVSVKDLIFSSLRLLGFGVDDRIFEFFAKSNKFVLLLDGFDEVRSEYVSSTISFLDEVSELYDELKIVVSSRPDSDIAKSRFFRVYELARLGSDDHDGIVRKLMGKSEQLEVLIDALKNSTDEFRGILYTPLMVTLFILIYKASQKIPEKFSDFYSNIFQMMLVRHDRSKPGYVRERMSKVNDRSLQTVFEAFCFCCSQKGLVSMSDSLIHDLANKAIKHTNIEIDSDAFLADITKVTCLILVDGFEYHFVHKSVREYYAAAFLKAQNDTVAKNFYEKMVKGYGGFVPELIFLREIDTFRFSKYFLVGYYERLADVYSMNLDCCDSESNYQWMFNRLRNVIVRFNQHHMIQAISWMGGVEDPFPSGFDFCRFSSRLLFDTVGGYFKEANLGVEIRDRLESIFAAGEIKRSVNAYDLLFEFGWFDDAKRLYLDYLVEFKFQFDEVLRYVQLEEEKANSDFFL